MLNQYQFSFRIFGRPSLIVIVIIVVIITIVITSVIAIVITIVITSGVEDCLF